MQHFQRGTGVLFVWVSGNFSFIYLQKTHGSYHDFRDTKQEVVFSFPFLYPSSCFCCSFLIRKGHQNPLPTRSFSIASFSFFWKKEEHGKQSGAVPCSAWIEIRIRSNSTHLREYKLDLSNNSNIHAYIVHKNFLINLF